MYVSRNVVIVVLRNNFFVMPFHKETHIVISVRINAIKIMLVICKPYATSLSLCEVLTSDNSKKHLLYYASPMIHTRGLHALEIRLPFAPRNIKNVHYTSYTLKYKTFTDTTSTLLLNFEVSL